MDDRIEDKIEGRNAVLEALRAGIEVNKLFVSQGDVSGSLKQIIAIAKEKSILIKEVSRKNLDSMSETRAHQGVIALISPIKYVSIEGILENANSLDQPPFIIILDGICDPNNLGSILRSCDAVGVHGVIIPKHNAVGVTPTVAKVSAGAYSYIPVCRVTNINTTIDALKKHGVWIAGTDSSSNTPFYEGNLTGPLAIVIGSEGQGMSRLTAKNCDFTINIPMLGEVSSLNAGVAAGIVMYEAFRQRNIAN